MNNRIEKIVGRTNFEYMLFISENAGVPHLFYKVNLNLRIVNGDHYLKLKILQIIDHEGFVLCN
jgi:hypothetical protein